MLYFNNERGGYMKSNLVVKSNDLIEARFNLTLNEQKLFLYAVSKIDKDLLDFNTIIIKG